jgi:PDZ domain
MQARAELSILVVVILPMPTAGWPLVALLVLAACGQLESEEAQEVARATQETVARGVGSAKEQLDRVDTAKIRAAWDATVAAMEDATKREPSASGPEPDPLADVAEAIVCDEARERCTVTADFAERARQHGGRVAAQLRVSPARGDVRGVRIDGIDPGTIAERVGLRVGDVVTDVNGTSLGSPQDAMLLYMNVRAAQSFVVGYRRGSDARSLQVDVV